MKSKNYIGIILGLVLVILGLVLELNYERKIKPVWPLQQKRYRKYIGMVDKLDIEKIV